MYIAILGRQPALGIAELERMYGDTAWFSSNSATVRTNQLNLDQLGGTVKAGRIVATLPHGSWRQVSQKIVQNYAEAWRGHTQKITLGISAYGFNVPAREVQKTGLVLKNKLKGTASLRLIPNTEAALGTATSHHNKLGLSDNKVELIVVLGSDKHVIIAESIGTQNITAYTKRDQGRPKRDAFVGMLPPKLAQIIINLASTDTDKRVLDPFCGTGVVLQEAALMGHPIYGTDLSDKMIDFSRTNLDWLAETHGTKVDIELHQGDAMTATWHKPIGAVACESYLGQPFSAPPSPSKLREVRGNCNHIISSFLQNIGRQLEPGTPLCVAVPAWRDAQGGFTHLPLTHKLEDLGYKRVRFQTIDSTKDLLYYREDQVVARELLVLVKQ